MTTQPITAHQRIAELEAHVRQLEHQHTTAVVDLAKALDALDVAHAEVRGLTNALARAYERAAEGKADRDALRRQRHALVARVAELENTVAAVDAGLVWSAPIPLVPVEQGDMLPRRRARPHVAWHLRNAKGDPC